MNRSIVSAAIIATSTILATVAPANPKPYPLLNPPKGVPPGDTRGLLR